MKQYGRFIDYLIELNIILLIFAFPLNLGFFNKLWMSLIIIWLSGKILRQDSVVMPPSGYFLLVFIGTIVISVIFSKQPDVSRGSVMYCIKGIALCMVLFDFSGHDEKRIDRIVHYFMASALMAAFYAFYQLFCLKGIDTRAHSFFYNTFYLALWSGIGILAAISKLLAKPSKLSFYAYEVSLLILGAALMLSKTRAPLIAVGIVLLIIVFYVPDKIKSLKYLAVFGVVTLLLFIYDETLRMRALSIFDSNTELRWTIWSQTLALIKAKFWMADWLIGRGPGVFKSEYIQFDHINYPFTFPHMIPVELFYAFGLMGVVAFLTWFIFLMYRLNGLLKNNTLDLHIKYIGLWPALVFLICLINESFFSRYFSFSFWFFTGILLALLRIEKAAVEKKGAVLD
ncbi:O-antigen ligase family protein [Desulfobacterium sp. N47]|uniref:O-antigen ligase-related domain-containing protein n=1 Tax=uncultured Desulfobacterium sp. TaxID=201089 RepID=E1YI54_9BACT|nr:hypothetical protein N47_D31320 [uncultured Desulfobacterium sp.]